MAHPIRRFTKKFIILLNSITALSFLLGCYGYWFNPQKFWFTGFFTLSSFYLLLVLLGFLFFWLLIKPKLILISFTAIILAWQPLRHLVQLRISTDFAVKKNNKEIRIMSWNVEHFIIAEHKTHPEKKQEMFRLIRKYNPDVASFQEMVASDNLPNAINYLPDIAQELNMPFYYYSYNSKLDYDREHHFGLIIFSKYPILNKKTISHNPHNYNSIFQYIDFKKDQDTLRVFNLHFQSLRFTDKDIQYIEEPIIDDETNFKQSRDVLHKFKTGFLKRQIQSELAKDEINKSPYPVIICGDFNDVPNSYAYSKIGKGLQNAFAEKGNGIGRTYSHFSPTLRIDNIFTDKNFEVKQFTRDSKKISDHFPIITDLYRNNP